MSWIFGFAEQQVDLKDKVNFKIYGLTTWEPSIDNAHIGQYLKK